MVTVSVVIPTYNRASLVAAAVESVLAQSFSDYEIIVADDGSSDDTPTILSNYGSRITYFRQDNQGESIARNNAATRASGEFLALLDSDDLWEPDKLAVQIPIIMRQPELVVLGSASRIIDEQGQLLSQALVGAVQEPALLTYHALRSLRTFYGPSTAVIRKAAFERVGGFTSHIRYGEDWDLWLKLSKIGVLAVHPQALVRIRQHSSTQTNTVSAAVVDRRLSDHLDILRRHPPLSMSNFDPPLAREYVRAAVDDISIGRCTLAQARIVKAMEYESKEAVLEDGVGLSLERARVMGGPKFDYSDSAVAFFSASTGLLAKACMAKDSWKSRAMGRFSVSMANMARSAGNYPACRRYLRFGLRRAGFRVLGEPGWIGGSIESTLGSTSYRLLRTLFERGSGRFVSQHANSVRS